MTPRKPIHYSQHARTAMLERLLDRLWIERAVLRPEWVTPDPVHPEIERRFVAVAERGGRILRVAVVETENEIRIVTAFLDRRARKSK